MRERVMCMLAMAAAMLAGCAVKTPASTERLAVVAGDRKAEAVSEPIEWPFHNNDLLDQWASVKAGDMMVCLPEFDSRGRRLLEEMKMTCASVRGAHRAGKGVLVECESPVEEARGGRVFLFLSSNTRAVFDWKESLGKSLATSPNLGVPIPVNAPRVLVKSRRGLPDVKAKGILVYLPPWSNWDLVAPVVREFQDRGWAVAQVGVPVGFVWNDENARHLRSDEASMGAGAAAAAAHIDATFAEWAFAVEAAVDEVGRTDPEAAKGPVVVFGTSAGALGTPAVAARLGERVRAVVLVGGGVNVFRIGLTGVVSDFGMGVTVDGHEPTPEDVDRLAAAFATRSRMDPGRLAGSLARTPVLVIDASKDTIVPARTGQELWEALGKPERWTFPTDHEMLFLRLGAYRSDIADWAEQAAGLH